MPALRLEVFEPDDSQPDPLSLDAAGFEALRSRVFEEGYASGWDDAQRHAEQTRDALRIAAEESLQGLNFTYAEAHAHLLRGFRPLVEAVVSTVLPALARQSLVPLIAEHLSELAQKSTQSPVTMQCNAATRDRIAPLIAQVAAPPIVFETEAGLGDGQVVIRFRDQESAIDLDHVCARISAATADFFALDDQDRPKLKEGTHD